MSELDRAIAIAVEAHAGQTDKAGEAYILHVLRVVLAVPAGVPRLVAALHDAVEDTPWTLEQIEAEGFGHTVVRAVDSITRRDGETYADYITRVADDDVARVVKLADLRDNLSRANEQTDPHGSLAKRYRKAIAVLDLTSRGAPA